MDAYNNKWLKKFLRWCSTQKPTMTIGLQLKVEDGRRIIVARLARTWAKMTVGQVIAAIRYEVDCR